MSTLNNNRWATTDADFAVRVELTDVPGFFSKSLKIDPGVRALFLEQGQSVGEAPPGEYTLQTLFDRLQFWSKKSTTVILTRAEEVPLDLDCTGLLTSEFLDVDAVVRLTVQIDDVALFLKNMLGPRPALSRDELRSAVLPVVRQALWETVGRLSVQDLTGQQARSDLELCIRQALQTSLTRHGLRFGQVQTLSVAHTEYDAQRRRTGQLWLQRNDLEFQEAEAKLNADRLFAETQQREHLDEIEILAKQVQNDRFEQELGVKLRRIGIRKEWRQAVVAAEFDKINSEEELRRFLQERDTARLIQEDEYAALTAALREKSEDRDAKRAFLLQKLEVEQTCELRGVRADLDHAFKLQALAHEQSLAQLGDAESARRWREELQREREAADQRRTQELLELEHARSKARVINTTNREEASADVLQDQQLDHVRGEIELAQADRRRRITLMELELTHSREEQRLGLKQRESELERQINADESDQQMSRWERLNKVKLERRKAESELLLQEQRTKAELDVLREDRAGQREIDKIQAVRGMGAIEVMAFSPNAAIIADVEKTRAVQQGQVGVAQAHAAATAGMSAETKELYERLSSANQAKADAAILAFQQALAAQQASFQQMGEVVNNVTRNLAPQPAAPPTVIAVGGGATSTVPAGGGGGSDVGVIVCPGCRTQNSRESRFCATCGKPL